MWLRRSLWVVVTTLSLYLLAMVGGGVLLAELALHPFRRAISEPQRVRANSLLLVDGASIQDVSIVAFDGAVMRGWFVPSKHHRGTAVILLHGVGDNRLGMYGYAQPLLHAGFDVLLPDARAHGQSDGSIATYGLWERNDIARWAEWLRTVHKERCVDGFGESMGAGQVLQAVNAAGFCAVMAESPFSDFRRVSYDRVGYYLGFGGARVGHTILRPLVDFALLYTRSRYGIDMTQANPAQTVRESHAPILLIHGEDDRNILPYHSQRLHREDPAHSTLWLVPGTAHCGAVQTDRAEFWQRTLQTLKWEQ